jgi:hypothetical protein
LASSNLEDKFLAPEIASYPHKTEWISLMLPWPSAVPPQAEQIEAALRQWGEPLRWAITRVWDGHLEIEAVVLKAVDS